MKRILFVGNTSWSMYNFRMGIFRSLRTLGFEVLICAPPDHTTALMEQEGFLFYPMIIDNKGTSPFNDLKLLRAYMKLYRSLKPDIIFHYTVKPNIYGTIAARLARLKSIAVVTGAGYSFMKDNWLSKLVKQLMRISFVSAREVWFLNKEDVDFFVSMGIVNPDKIQILPGEGIDTGYFDACDKTHSSGDFTFLFLGRVIWDKGVGEYVEASRLLKHKNLNVNCQILGFLDAANPSAIQEDTVKQWEMDGLISYLGVTGDVKKFIEASDCVVLPSYREGMPRSLMEAASMKRPIITTDAIGCKDVVEDGKTGFVVNIRDSVDLAEKMERMYSLNVNQRISMGEMARLKMMNEFDQGIVLNIYLKTLNKII